MKALEWVIAQKGIEKPSEFYCETRDVAQARVEKMRPDFIAHKWSDDESGLLGAIAGELTGNCFDHNLGNWPNVPGCWFEYEVDDSSFKMVIADRGRGVLRTLRQVRPGLKDDRAALGVAFTEIVTGRAPEQRGNGLKFVIRSLGLLRGLQSFLFVSGDAALMLAGKVDTLDVLRYIAGADTAVSGTYVELSVRKNI
jgi:anti-sigma regulatory factor (Ser/Thr protein kinase)